MKLYTEETIRFIAKAIYEHDFDSEKTSDELVDELTTAIELPSDEEIDLEGIGCYNGRLPYADGFIDGAKWVIEQIKQQEQ